MIFDNTSTQLIHCYVALGSNLGESAKFIKDGLETLENHTEISNVSVSRFYQSKPHGPQDQPDYINAVVEFETSLTAINLLDELQQIENDNGREREGIERWGARTLDLDLLFYGDDIIDEKRLTVPHPRICERAFVLYPLRDLLKNKDLKINNKTTLKECIAMLSEKAKSEIKEYHIDD